MEEQVWRYNYGSWSRMSSPVEFEDENGDLLEAPAGYSTRTRWFGDEEGFGAEVYSADPESDTEVPAPYLVMIYNVGDNIERVFVEDFPSLLQLLQDLGPFLDLPNETLEPEEEFEEDGSEEP